MLTPAYSSHSHLAMFDPFNFCIFFLMMTTIIILQFNPLVLVVQSVEALADCTGGAVFGGYPMLTDGYHFEALSGCQLRNFNGTVGVQIPPAAASRTLPIRVTIMDAVVDSITALQLQGSTNLALEATLPPVFISVSRTNFSQGFLTIAGAFAPHSRVDIRGNRFFVNNTYSPTFGSGVIIFYTPSYAERLTLHDNATIRIEENHFNLSFSSLWGNVLDPMAMHLASRSSSSSGSDGGAGYSFSRNTVDMHCTFSSCWVIHTHNFDYTVASVRIDGHRSFVLVEENHVTADVVTGRCFAPHWQLLDITPPSTSSPNYHNSTAAADGTYISYSRNTIRWKASAHGTLGISMPGLNISNAPNTTYAIHDNDILYTAAVASGPDVPCLLLMGVQCCALSNSVRYDDATFPYYEKSDIQNTNPRFLLSVRRNRVTVVPAIDLLGVGLELNSGGTNVFDGHVLVADNTITRAAAGATSLTLIRLLNFQSNAALTAGGIITATRNTLPGPSPSAIVFHTAGIVSVGGSATLANAFAPRPFHACYNTLQTTPVGNLVVDSRVPVVSLWATGGADEWTSARACLTATSSLTVQTQPDGGSSLSLSAATNSASSTITVASLSTSPSTSFAAATKSNTTTQPTQSASVSQLSPPATHTATVPLGSASSSASFSSKQTSSFTGQSLSALYGKSSSNSSSITTISPSRSAGHNTVSITAGNTSDDGGGSNKTTTQTMRAKSLTKTTPTATATLTPPSTMTAAVVTRTLSATPTQTPPPPQPSSPPPATSAPPSSCGSEEKDAVLVGSFTAPDNDHSTSTSSSPLVQLRLPVAQPALVSALIPISTWVCGNKNDSNATASPYCEVVNGGLDLTCRVPETLFNTAAAAITEPVTCTARATIGCTNFTLIVTAWPSNGASATTIVVTATTIVGAASAGALVLLLGDPTAIEMPATATLLLGPCASVASHDTARVAAYLFSPLHQIGQPEAVAAYVGTSALVTMGHAAVVFGTFTILQRSSPSSFWSVAGRLWFPNVPFAVAAALYPAVGWAVASSARQVGGNAAAGAAVGAVAVGCIFLLAVPSVAAWLIFRVGSPAAFSEAPDLARRAPLRRFFTPTGVFTLTSNSNYPAYGPPDERAVGWVRGLVTGRGRLAIAPACCVSVAVAWLAAGGPRGTSCVPRMITASVLLAGAAPAVAIVRPLRVPAANAFSMLALLGGALTAAGIAMDDNFPTPAMVATGAVLVATATVCRAAVTAAARIVEHCRQQERRGNNEASEEVEIALAPFHA